MTLSCVIIAFNAEKTLSICIESIQKQTVPLHEIIVIDDNSSDETVKIAKSYSCKIFKNNRTLGRGYCRNKGVEVCNSDLILFCDSSNYLNPKFCEKALTYFNSDYPSAIFGSIRNCPKLNGMLSRWRGRHLFHETDYYHNEVIISPTLITYAAILRRKHVISVGNFNTNLVQFEDLDLGKRLIDHNFTILSLPSLITFSCRSETIMTICSRYNRWNTLNLNKKRLTPIIFFNILKSSLRIFLIKDLQSRDLYCCLFSLFFPLLFLTIRILFPHNFNK